MEKVRFGIIGIGNMGTNHAKSLFENTIEGATLSAICDTNPKRIEYAKENFKGVSLFDDATKMYKSGEIDAVIVAVPHYDHPRLSMEAFENNIHVMCEKPAGVFTKEVKKMNEAAEKASVIFGMMFNQRTNSVFKKAREMVINGELGDIRRSVWIITNWYRPQFYYDSGDWRATWAGEGGGVLLNQCPHNLDLWQWICGMPNKITAFCHEGKWHDIEVEDDVTAYTEYPNGATGVFITTTADTPGTNRLEITGDKGKLVYEDEKLTFYKLETPESEFTKTNKIAFASPKFEKIEIETDGQNPQHKGVLQAFTYAISKGEPLVANGVEGINGLTLSNAMHLSSWLGKTIELPFDEDLFYDELQKKVKSSKKKDKVETVVADLSNTYNS